MCNSDNETVSKILVHLAKDIYKDCFSPALKNIGTGLDYMTATIKFITLPGVFTGDLADAIRKKYQLFLSSAFEKVPENKLTSPDAKISISIIQNVLQSFDDDDIREMYSNLLASASNKDKKQLTHPSFPQIITQLDSLDAKILSTLYNKSILPFIEVKHSFPEMQVHDLPFQIIEPFTLIEGYENNYEDVSASLNALSHLGLIQKTTVYFDVIDNSPYDKIYASDIFEPIRKIMDDIQHNSLQSKHNPINVIHGSFMPTTLGNKFLATCIASTS